MQVLIRVLGLGIYCGSAWEADLGVPLQASSSVQAVVSRLAL